MIYKIKISNKMIKKEENIRSESFYPDSSFYINSKKNDVSDKDNTIEETKLSRDQADYISVEVEGPSNTTEFEWPNS